MAARYPAGVACAVAWGGGLAEGSIVDVSMFGASIVIESQEAPAGSVWVIAEQEGLDSVVVPAAVIAVEPDPFGGQIVRMRFELDLQGAAPLAQLVEDVRARFQEEQHNLAGGHLGMHGAAHLKGNRAAG